MKRYYSNVSPTIPNLVMASGTNIGASIVKDRAFATMFAAPGHVARSVPMASLGLFAMRDGITVGNTKKLSIFF
jgi:hypothetical protein